MIPIERRREIKKSMKNEFRFIMIYMLCNGIVSIENVLNRRGIRQSDTERYDRDRIY